MTQQVQDIMTKHLHIVRSDTTLLDVAKMMRDQRVGDVLVTNRDGSLRGIVTDRDIVVRAAASGKHLDRTQVGEICTDRIVKLAPSATIDEAVKVMREHAIRRVPVVHDNHPIGIVSIGDLAREKDPNSVLAQISAAAANN
jgi:CBS domain-containing protein